MMERRQVVDFWERERAVVLVTLVAVEGSSYRQPGARLIAGAGAMPGTISGGCLETDVVKKATWLTRAGAAVERYSMAFDDTADIPFGLGCGGTVDLLFEPLERRKARRCSRRCAARWQGWKAPSSAFCRAAAVGCAGWSWAEREVCSSAQA